jgi:IS5 family transposase
VKLIDYTVGKSREGADAYPPLMLLKGLLLRKWYRIDSDPELENHQINDRISFKNSWGCPSILIPPTIPPFPDFEADSSKRR